MAVGASCLDMERTAHCGELWRETRGREGEGKEQDVEAEKGRKVKENERSEDFVDENGDEGMMRHRGEEKE